MNKIVPGPMRVMKWIEKEVAGCIDRGATSITWVTPSGFRGNTETNEEKRQIYQVTASWTM